MDRGEADQWYAVRVKPNCERTAATVLSAKGFEHCLPVYKDRRRWSDRYKTVELPLFPGYIFCRFDRGRRAAVVATPGVLHVVSFGGVPAPVDAAEVAALQAIGGSGLAAEPWPYVEAGQWVRIVEGPIAGVCGIVCGFKSRQRLVVNVTLLKRAVCVEVDSDWVSPVVERSHPARLVSPAFMPDGYQTGRSLGAVPAR